LGWAARVAALAAGNLLIGCASSVFAASLSSPPLAIEQAGLERTRSFIEFVSSEIGFGLKANDTDITTFKLVGSDKVIYTQDVIEIALLHPGAIANAPFCAALVKKSSYPAYLAQTWLPKQGPRAGIRDVIWYDGRLTQDLIRKIKEGMSLASQNICDELIANYDYRRAGKILEKLGLDPDLGPFLLTINLATGKFAAISFSHYEEVEMEDLVRKWQILSSFRPSLWANLDTAGAQWLSLLLYSEPPAMYFDSAPSELRF